MQIGHLYNLFKDVDDSVNVKGNRQFSVVFTVANFVS